MKKAATILVLFSGFTASAQSEAIQKMVKQIALLQIYIGYVEKGYSIARKGLNTISDIRNGHWELDIDFFNSLKNVNPRLKKYSKVAAIIDYQTKIVKLCRQLKKQRFNNDEVIYINTVIVHLLEASETMIDQMSLLLTDHQLQLTDDERINQIDRIYATIWEQYEFIQHFSAEAILLIKQRKKEESETSVSQKLNGL